MESNLKSKTPRVKIIQKLYSKTMNPDEKIIYNKSQYKKFIKDVTEGTLERKELIEETIEKFLKNDINFKRTDILLKIILQAAVFELLFKHNNSKKVIISEYLKINKNKHLSICHASNISSNFFRVTVSSCTSCGISQ